MNLSPSCYFADRCEHCMDVCTAKLPHLKQEGETQNHQVACWLYDSEKVAQ